MMIGKKAKMEWEYIVAFLIGLAVLVVVLSFSQYVRDKFIEGVKHIALNLLGM